MGHTLFFKFHTKLRTHRGCFPPSQSTYWIGSSIRNNPFRMSQSLTSVGIFFPILNRSSYTNTHSQTLPWAPEPSASCIRTWLSFHLNISVFPEAPRIILLVKISIIQSFYFCCQFVLFIQNILRFFILTNCRIQILLPMLCVSSISGSRFS